MTLTLFLAWLSLATAQEPFSNGASGFFNVITDCKDQCYKVTTTCVKEGGYCIQDSYNYDPAFPCGGGRDNNREEVVSTCPICDDGLYCVANRCTAPQEGSAGRRCCPLPNNPNDPPACSLESGLRDKFCEPGFECLGNVPNSTCTKTTTSYRVLLQYDDDCNDETRPWEQCAGDILACQRSVGKCRYFDPDQCTKNGADICDAWGIRPFDTNFNGRCSSDDECKFGEYCVYDEGSSYNVCKERSDDGSCGKAFYTGNQNSDVTSSFTGACPATQICLIDNPYGNQLLEEGSCANPFSLNEGDACIYNDEGQFHCKAGLRCVCNNNRNCQCAKPGSPVCNSDGFRFCNTKWTRAGRTSYYCPDPGYNKVQEPSCQKSSLPGDVPDEKWLKTRWDSSDKAFFNCLEQNNCQIRQPNTKCAMDNNCVRFLDYNVTWRSWGDIFNGNRNSASATEGVKFSCKKQASLDGYPVYALSSAQALTPQVALVFASAALSLFLF